MVCRKDLRNRLRRAEGQLGGIVKMLDNDASCQDVLTQLMAARTSIDRVISLVAVDNLMECMDTPQRDEQAVKDAVNLLTKYR